MMNGVCSLCRPKKWLLEELKEPYPALIRAVANNHLQCVRLIIQKGANVNAVGDKTALITAVAQGNQSCVEYLIKSGASVNIADSSGRTPLIVSSKYGRQSCTKVLLRHGAKVDVCGGRRNSSSTSGCQWQ